MMFKNYRKIILAVKIQFLVDFRVKILIFLKPEKILEFINFGFALPN